MKRRGFLKNWEKLASTEEIKRGKEENKKRKRGKIKRRKEENKYLPTLE